MEHRLEGCGGPDPSRRSVAARDWTRGACKRWWQQRTAAGGAPAAEMRRTAALIGSIDRGCLLWRRVEGDNPVVEGGDLFCAS